ncbi:ABC transporter permease [Pigmentiphaga sp.]|uniref:ABC transporter permease n=1 Tax=Pigmentiphaga sp. TaxID=1977564 RepID=UPI0025F2BFC2|nr:ABC transporter permease [Pigmentiphaga sp.]
MFGMVKVLWSYRGFIVGNVKREFQLKYRNSLLGAAWTVLNPLSMIIIYTVIFSQVMRAKLPGVEGSFAYSIHLCAGVLTWGLFAEIISRAQNTFIDNANLLKKLSFPRLCLPAAVVANGLVNFSIIFFLFSIFLVISGNFPGWPFLAMLPILTVMVAFAIGLGITLGVLNVFFRDVGHFFGIFLNFWFWATPIVYPIGILPQRLQSLVYLNPMATLVDACQTILMQGKWPNWPRLAVVALVAVLFCALGLRLFRKHAGEMVDEL